ncbi:hypothetical protein [Marinobacterium rhizophilum]|uniref:Uncharacterized protein n=1 Tax=Marinobacterium rhizophilum TaxID=420402 RepID=A0ABY5HM51_9GAMM|nr:hypothetical protein [Marinobacterium rhizophilum]UTW13034.1 hypothetical protein KDW95_05070 [Marinobacterium rhizophilum]
METDKNSRKEIPRRTQKKRQGKCNLNSTAKAAETALFRNLQLRRRSCSVRRKSHEDGDNQRHQKNAPTLIRDDVHDLYVSFALPNRLVDFDVRASECAASTLTGDLLDQGT